MITAVCASKYAEVLEGPLSLLEDLRKPVSYRSIEPLLREIRG